MKNNNKFNLFMISAMYENGGNTMHRFLDGHPELYVYPFESQVGTNLLSDHLETLFPLKYRWAEFSLNGTFDNDYELIIDEELKRHVKTPFASKFRDADMKLDDRERKKIFMQLLKGKKRNRKNIIEAFFVSTFKAWRNYRKSGKEIAYLGYSPIIGVDADKIFKDFPNAHIIHIVRNPYSSYAETKNRPVPYSLKRYCETWSIVQYYALTFTKKYTNNFHLVKFEDLIVSPRKFFKNLTGELRISYDKTLEYPSWNGRRLDVVAPWGTIESASTKTNKQIMEELTSLERQEVKKYTQIINEILGYDKL